ncbi:MAG: cysteine synthase A [Campylobacterales bacterium]|nr:cysteine synthase A [Campylobacterales bacterium]
MNVAMDVSELIGKTPIVRINSLSEKYGVELMAKCEFMNPSGSVKDRIAKCMIQDGINKGTINKDTTIIEPTSGNTGIGLASICAGKGLKLILTMPESMSMERRILLSAYGAKLELTPSESGMKGAIEKADELSTTIENSVVLGQFENPANPKAHRESTALEILDDLGRDLDIFVAAVGTGGTITGTSEVLKQRLSHLEVIAVEPKDSAVLSCNTPGPHKIQGIGAGFIPDVLNCDVYDKILKIDNDSAYDMSRKLAKEEGLLVGISAGANICAAEMIAKEYQGSGKKILTILCDTGERYLSSDLFTM